LQVKNHKRGLHKNNSKAKVYSPRLPSVFLAQLIRVSLLHFKKNKIPDFTTSKRSPVIMKWILGQMFWSSPVNERIAKT
jgi:hypothetical protein